MLKSQYTLVQTTMCGASGNFAILQGFPEMSEASSIGNNNNKQHFPTQINSGQFKESQSCRLLNCTSCRAIKNLTLTIYGQVISKAYIDSCCNLLPCIISQQLIVTTLSEVLIGKVTKESCFSKNILKIMNSHDNIRYFIRKKQCYCIAYLPRAFRCDSQIVYEIVDDKQKIVGSIINRVDGCFKAFWTYLDNYQINFPPNSNDKERILLMNALVYLDVIKHQMF